MTKIVLVLSLLSLLFLASFGAYYPEEPLMFLASESMNFAILRVFLIAVLLGLLLTHPPRNKYFRALVGGLSVVLITWAVGATYLNEMRILDTLSLLGFGTSAGLMVLEHKPQKNTRKENLRTSHA